jgi:hypothetical protein
VLFWILFPLGCVAAFVAGFFVASLCSAAKQGDRDIQCATCYESLTSEIPTGKGGIDAHSGCG